jgi:pilus assembly protein Flp/PilA
MNCATWQMFWNDESGQDLIEYSLLLALVALAAVALLGTVGNSVTKIWSGIGSTLSSASGG